MPALFTLFCACSPQPPALPAPPDTPTRVGTDRLPPAAPPRNPSEQAHATSVAFALELIPERELKLSEALNLAEPPEGSLWLLVRLRPPRGAHLYWKNPGGTGLETQASVFAPEGYRVGEALYPGPMRFRSGRGTVSYGYPSETALFVLLERLQSPGPSIPSFDVAASWLSCDHFCTKEGRRETITLGERPRENWESVANLSARLPRALPPDIDVLRPSSFELRVHGPKNTRLLEYFPIAPSIGDFEDVLQDRPDSRTLVVRSANSGALTEGVLSVTRNNVEAWYLITEQSRPSHPLGGRP